MDQTCAFRLLYALGCVSSEYVGELTTFLSMRQGLKAR